MKFLHEGNGKNYPRMKFIETYIACIYASIYDFHENLIWFDGQSQWCVHYASCSSKIMAQGMNNSKRKLKWHYKQLLIKDEQLNQLKT